MAATGKRLSCISLWSSSKRLEVQNPKAATSQIRLTLVATLGASHIATFIGYIKANDNFFADNRPGHYYTLEELITYYYVNKLNSNANYET